MMSTSYQLLLDLAATFIWGSNLELESIDHADNCHIDGLKQMLHLTKIRKYIFLKLLQAENIDTTGIQEHTIVLKQCYSNK